MVLLWDKIWTVDWWASNLGIIVGSFLGAVFAYAFGYKLLKRQLEDQHNEQNKKDAKQELKFLKIVDSDLRELSDCLNMAKNNQIALVGYEKIFADIEDEFWTKIIDHDLVQSLDELCDAMKPLRTLVDAVMQEARERQSPNMNDKSITSVLPYLSRVDEISEMVRKVKVMIEKARQLDKKILARK